MKYAQSPYDTALKKQIEELFALHSAKKECDVNIWFLFDGILLDPGDLKQLRSNADQSRGILHKTSYTIDDYDFGPWIMQAPDNPYRRIKWLEMLINTCSGIPVLSIIVTEHAIENLEKTLETLVTVRTSNQQNFYCRFADTRIIPTLIRTLNNEQKETSLTSMKFWYFVNRSGNLEQIYKKDYKHSNSEQFTAIPIELTDNQFSLMLEASEADNIFSLLCDTAPELVPDVQCGVFYKKLKRILDQARTICVLATQDQLQYSILALGFGEEFYQHPLLQESWKRIATQENKLQDLVDNWPDSLWHTLDSYKIEG